MKKLFALVLTICSFVTNGQTLLVSKYSQIANNPTLGTTSTIVPGDATCCGNGIFQPPANHDVRPNGNFNGSPGGFAARQWDSTAVWRIVPTAGTVLGTASGTGHGFSQNGYGNNQRLYGQDASNPGFSQGQFGVFFTASYTGGNFKVYNWVASSTTAGSFQFNSDAGGPHAFYDSVFVEKCKSLNSGQEGFYGGATHTGYAYIKYSFTRDFFAYFPTREPWQIAHANNARLRNLTSIGAGQGHVGSQDRNFQFDDSNGRVDHNIFYNGYEAGQAFSHGWRMDHNFLSWSNNASTANFLIGRTDTQYFAGSIRLNGDSVIVEYNCIKKEGTGAIYAFDVQLRDAPIIFRNNTLDNITTMYQDNRVSSPSNTITGAVGDHGNVTGTCPTPTFYSNYNDVNAPIWQGKSLPNDTWHNLYYGYLNDYLNLN